MGRPDPMAADPALAPEGAAAPPPRRVRIPSLIAKTILVLVAFPLLALAVLGLLLDTDLGHRLILDRVAAMTPKSGLRIRIGRIEGSIWGETGLRDVRLYDQDGLFAEIPKAALKWRPLAWLANRLLIDTVATDLAIVHRAPNFIPSEEGGGMSLPDFDVHVGRLDIAQLRFDEAVTGFRQVARVGGEAEYRSGRFLLDLDAVMRGGGDRLDLLVDAFPERDQFDLDLALEAPADGVLARMLGTRAPLRMAVTGDGSWHVWNGTARIEAAGRSAGDLRLAARSGRYSAGGWIAPAGLLGGRLASLAAPRLAVGAQGTFEDEVLAGRIEARSATIRLMASGTLGDGRYDDVRFGLELLRSAPLFGDAQAAAGTRVTTILDGPYESAALVYRATAPSVRAGTTIVEQVQASGSGRWSDGRLALPIAARAARVTGAGTPILANLRLTGSASLDGDRLAARDLVLAADRATARFALQADLSDGRYAAAGTASAEGFALAGLGQADLAADWRISSADLRGTIRGTIRRSDHPALAWAARGPLRIESAIASGPGGNLSFTDTRLTSPGLQLQGSGRRGADGALVFEARGRQATLGPLGLRYANDRLLLRLVRPAPSLGLADVELEVAPARAGFAYHARGSSPLGPFDARGSVVPASDTLHVAMLNVSGATGSGTLRAADGGFTGRIDFGGGLVGPIELAMADRRQTVSARLIASDPRIGDIPLGRGRIEADVAIADGEALSGRIRFDGGADRLWSATGITAARLTGPLSVEAALGGNVAAPTIDGRLRLTGGRLVAAATTVEQVELSGTFDRTRLTVTSLAGQTSSGGRVAGSGVIGFDGALAFRLAGDGVSIAQDGLDSVWRGGLLIGGTVAAPSIRGDATLIRGTYRLLGRAVELSRGTLRFDGSPDPLLDIVAPAPGGIGSIRIRGRASRPEIALAPFGARRAPPEQPGPNAETAPAPLRRGRLTSRS
jgi:translocation and assembly module TamB